MDRHAGFAAAVEIEQQMLAAILRALYDAGQLGPNLPLAVSGLNGTVFVTVPTVVFARANADQLSIQLRGWGSFSVTPPGRPMETAFCNFATDLLAGATATVASSSVNFGADATNATLVAFQLVPVTGAFSPEAQAYLASAPLLAAVQASMRSLLAILNLLFPPINISFLGAIASSTSTRVTVRVLDGVLALGLDLTAAPVITAGDSSLLVEFTEGMDLAMWTNPAAVPVAYQQVRAGAQQAVDDQHATLDSFTMSVVEGAFAVAGHASKDGSGVAFSLRAVPKLVRPGTHEEWDEEYGEHFVIDTPPRDELWFDIQDVEVDVERAWWVVLLDVLGAGIAGLGTLIVEAFVQMVRGNVTSGIYGAGGTQAARTQQFTLPNVTRPTMQIRIERVECHTEGVFTGVLFQVNNWIGSLSGPTAVSADELGLGLVVPRYAIVFPPDVFASDPALRAEWTARNLDDNTIVRSVDVLASDATGITLDPDAILLGSRFRIDCRLYRVFGATIDEVYTLTTQLIVVDRLDRSHPYVRWTHEAITPNVRVEADGSQTIIGYVTHLRHSDLHRTVVPGRCRMVSKFSPKAVPEYLDALPFPRAELDQRRASVCDYCFYGGPDKTVPLIP